MKPMEFSCIVEGHGEVEAVPILIRRLALRIDPSLHVKVHQPFRCHAGQFRNNPRERCRALELAARHTHRQGGIIIIYDLEDECPATVAPPLLRQIKSEIGDIPLSLVFAYREFETWFLAAAESLRGVCGLPVDLVAPANPEQYRAAKGWLKLHMGRGGYRETLHQAKFAEAFDLDAASSVPSFDKLLRDFNLLVNHLRSR